MIEPQVDPIQAEQMFMDFVEQLLKRCNRSHAQQSMHSSGNTAFLLTVHPQLESVKAEQMLTYFMGWPINDL